MINLEKLLSEHLWTLNVVLTLVCTTAVHFFSSRIMRKLAVKAEQKQLLYPEALLKALHKPITFLIWLLGISIALAIIFSSKSYPILVAYLLPVKKSGIIFAITWATIRFIRKVETLTIQNAPKRNKDLDETMVHALALLLIITVVAISGMGIMQLFGLPISGLLAFGGIGGAGIAFASKDLLANFFGGLVVYMDKPFKVGHWIRSPDKNIEGMVEHIGWRVTRIRTFDKRPLYVPNSFFLNISVENASRMLNRRIKTMIGVRYEDASKISNLTEQMKNMLSEHPGVDKKQPFMVSLFEFGPSSLDIQLDAFTKATKRIDYQIVRQDILMKVLAIIEDNHAECAYPTQTLFLQKDN
ncbi:MAG: mechanosensitive ion channel family protein [Legionellaceae bacterium]|nr:mechanosensitive ion channel family protein [Legionellaceae bacterium]